MGLTLLLGWRRTRTDSFLRGLIAPCVTALAITVSLWAVGIRDAIALLGFALIGFSTVATIAEFVIGIRARHRATAEAYHVAAYNLVRNSAVATAATWSTSRSS